MHDTAARRALKRRSTSPNTSRTSASCGDLRALARHQQARRLPDAHSRTRDERHLSFESIHPASFPDKGTNIAGRKQ
jgi:hypothetical protein